MFVIAVQITCRTSAWFIEKRSTAWREARMGSKNGRAKQDHQKAASPYLASTSVASTSYTSTTDLAPVVVSWAVL